MLYAHLDLIMELTLYFHLVSILKYYHCWITEFIASSAFKLFSNGKRRNIVLERDKRMKKQ